MLKVLQLAGFSDKAANRGASLDKKINQVASDKAARAGHQRSWLRGLLRHKKVHEL
jgi:hypothetical protein